MKTLEIKLLSFCKNGEIIKYKNGIAKIVKTPLNNFFRICKSAILERFSLSNPDIEIVGYDSVKMPYAEARQIAKNNPEIQFKMEFLGVADIQYGHANKRAVTLDKIVFDKHVIQDDDEVFLTYIPPTKIKPQFSYKLEKIQSQLLENPDFFNHIAVRKVISENGFRSALCSYEIRGFRALKRANFYTLDFNNEAQQHITSLDNQSMWALVHKNDIHNLDFS